MRWSIALILTGCVPELVSPDSNDSGSDTEWACGTNRWPGATPPEDLQGEGFYVGETVPDFQLLDQFGEPVCMWQFYGQVTVLDISTMWCGPCQELACYTEDTADDFAEHGFSYLTVLPENVSGDNPSQEDLNLWADTFAIQDAPVIADPDKGYTGDAVSNGQYPLVLVVGADLKVKARFNGPQDAELRAAIAGELGIAVPEGDSACD